MSRIVGHYAPWWLAVLIGSLVGVTLVPAVSKAVPWYAWAVLLVVALCLGLAILAHNRRLCERCITSLPLNASAAAGRYARRLRVAHLFENKMFAICYLVTVAGLSLLYSHPVGRYGWAAAAVSLIYLLFVYVTHQRLQPWCPGCRSGGQERTTTTGPGPILTRA